MTESENRTDNLTLMTTCNLNEIPYNNLKTTWCRDGYQVMFVEENLIYCETLGKTLSTIGDVICLEIDVQQFLGWQPTVFTQSMEITWEEFEQKYEEVM